MRGLIAAVRRGTVAALVWGVASAAVTRVLMRGVALTTHGTTSFTLFGTIGIAVIYVLALLPGSVALAISPGRWPWLVYAGGIGFLLFGALNIGGSSISHAHDMTPVRWVLLTVVVGAMAVVYAAQFRMVARWARPRTSTDDPPLRGGHLRPDRTGGHRAAVRAADRRSTR